MRQTERSGVIVQEQAAGLCFVLAARAKGLPPAVRESNGMASSKKKQQQSLLWQVFPSDFGPLLVVASDEGVCRIAFGEGADEVADLFPEAALTDASTLEAADADARHEWLISAARSVSHPEAREFVPLVLRGTPFQEQVWQALKHIPAGETRSYRQVAETVGAPHAVRAVGSAIGANPVAVLIPCHRVLRSDGALGGYAYGLDIKRQLLAREARTEA